MSSAGGVPNAWSRYSTQLAELYEHSPGRTVAGELLGRALAERMGTTRHRVVDIGGGAGEVAIRLASLGHDVTLVDFDQRMLDLAARRLAAGSPDLRRRLRLVRSEGAGAAAVVGTGFDVVCCHSVVMYESDPAPLLGTLVSLARPGGLVSVSSVNPEALALRPGLQGRWADALESLRRSADMDSRTLPAHPHRRDVLSSLLETAGARVLAWSGIGVFTDHLERIPAEESALVLELEWLAGLRDPYRQVARCFHLLARRDADA